MSENKEGNRGGREKVIKDALGAASTMPVFLSRKARLVLRSSLAKLKKGTEQKENPTILLRSKQYVVYHARPLTPELPAK